MMTFTTKPCFFQQSLKRVAVGVLGTATLFLVTTQSTIAQTSETGSSSGIGSSDRPLNSLDDGGGLDMYDLMHQMQRGSIRNQYDFLRDQQESISEEARRFRDLQRNAVNQSPTDLTQPPSAVSEPSPLTETGSN